MSKETKEPETVVAPKEPEAVVERVVLVDGLNYELFDKDGRYLVNRPALQGEKLKFNRTQATHLESQGAIGTVDDLRKFLAEKEGRGNAVSALSDLAPDQRLAYLTSHSEEADLTRFETLELGRENPSQKVLDMIDYVRKAKADNGLDS